MDEEIVRFGFLDPEIQLFYMRSSGPGGQNVNKVNSKVELRFDIMTSVLLSDNQKVMIIKKYRSKISDSGIMILTCQTNRSQLKNKESVLVKFYSYLNRALLPTKERIKTKPTAISKEKRLKDKREKSEKKERRKTL